MSKFCSLTAAFLITWQKLIDDTPNSEDVTAVRQGLADGAIDVIASDYAPEPRITGIAGFRSFLPLCYGLVLQSVLSEKQLKEKLFLNPIKIITNGGYKLKLKNV